MNYTNKPKYFKQDEIQDYINDYINDNKEYLIDLDIQDLHHDLFNTDYYLIGFHQCTEWLGKHVFECINIIKEYEQDNFGEIYTDLSSSEKVVNMYIYIVGEELLYNMQDELIQNNIINE